jgi:hypothetical protein
MPGALVRPDKNRYSAFWKSERLSNFGKLLPAPALRRPTKSSGQSGLDLTANVVPGPSGITDSVANVAVFALSELDTLYTGLGTQLEGNKRDLFGYDQADPIDNAGDDARARLSISGVNGYPPAVSDTISFFVGAGENFLIWAGLQSKARDGGLADASSTFLIVIQETNGASVDRSMLGVTSLDSVGVVPLPAGVWLFLSGIGIIAGLSRRGKQSLPS